MAGLFTVGLVLQGAFDLPRDVTPQRITEALRRLDEIVREIRNHVFAGRGQSTEPGLAWIPPPHVLEHSALAGNRPELLQRRGVQTANAVPSAAAGIGALLERHAVLLRGAGGHGLTTFTASEVVVDADVPEIPVGIDGEMIMMPTPVRCTIQPNALRVRVPRNRPGIRPPKPELDWSALRRLASWRPGPWNQGHFGSGVPSS